MTALRSGDGALYRDNPQRSSKRCGRRISADFDRRLQPMSMLTFYINRAGKNLSAEERETLEAAKPELRALFGR